MPSDLCLAIERHDTQRVAELLAAGADPSQPEPDWPGWTPLQVAVEAHVEGGPFDAVDLLLGAGADVNGWDAGRNMTPLLLACFRKNRRAVARLLDAGAEPDVRSGEGDSPLRLWVGLGDREVVAHLLRCGADRSVDAFGGPEGLTPLGIAAGRFDVPMIELLLRAGADPTVTDDVGKTARDYLPPRASSDPSRWDRVMETLGRGKVQEPPGPGGSPAP